MWMVKSLWQAYLLIAQKCGNAPYMLITPKTDSYKALFHAGLLLTGQKEIDLLVTGLLVLNSKMKRCAKICANDSLVSTKSPQSGR